MNAVSAGTEPDTGTRYPTLMQDTNGNQILIRYMPGSGVGYPDSSGRIKEIEDVRAVVNGSTRATYLFNYTADALPRLQSVTNTIQSGEEYQFTIGNLSLTSPFGGAVFPATNGLYQVTRQGVNLSHQFQYNNGERYLNPIL